jgi:hypothetical protein
MVITKCIFLDYELFEYEKYRQLLVAGIDVQIVNGKFKALSKNFQHTPSPSRSMSRSRSASRGGKKSKGYTRRR